MNIKQNYNLFSVIFYICFNVLNADFLSTSIPKSLRHCYENDFRNRTIYPPLNIQVLIELIRKLEFNQKDVVNIRILTTSLLHSVRLDGIEKSELGVESPYSIPYGATGNQFHKFKLLIDHFIFGDTRQFHNETLNEHEICILHLIISSSLDKWERGDESISCQRKSLPQILTERDLVVQRTRRISDCPIEKGVVRTKWGTISPGHLIAGISAAFQESNVTFARLLEDLGHGNNITQEITRSSEVNLNNVLVSTIVGDLAEVVLNQAFYEPNLGDTGRWNDSVFPRAHYLDGEQWDMTVAELLGGIDGLILASRIRKWTGILVSTRFSQILDMYYSERGIGYDGTYRACERKSKITDLFDGVDFVTQTSATAKLLQSIGKFDRYLSEDGIDNYTIPVVRNYKTQAESIIEHYDAYYQNSDNITNIEIITILDGTWTPYEVLSIISYLTEVTDVSYYGSRIGVINGQNGVWMANVTNDVIKLFGSLTNVTSWPSTLQLSTSLRTVISYYQNKTEPDCFTKSLRPVGHVILVLANTALISDNDARQTELSLQTLKQSHPDIKIIYVASETNAHHYTDFSRNDYANDIVIETSNDIQIFVDKISEKLNTVGANIINFYCNTSIVEVEDYITPRIDTLYEIHSDYIRRADINIKFKGNNYGDFSICAYNANSIQNKFCKDITVNDEVSFNPRDQCSTEEDSCTVQFSVSAYNSRFICAEMDCRYPDQARLDITTSWTTRSTSSFILPNTFLISVVYMIYMIVI